MGLLKSIGNFLFGKTPEIFDHSGNIVHKLSKRTWESWNNSIKMDPNYNWRNHTGTRANTYRQNHKNNPPNNKEKSV